MTIERRLYPVGEVRPAVANVYIHLGNAQTGEVDAVGPFDFVQITYDYIVRVQSAAEYPDDFTIATYSGDRGAWVLDDGSEWTDLTVSTQEPIR